jgi:hypothetical protein
VRCCAAHPADTKAHPLREAIALLRQERRVSRDDADDRAGIVVLLRKSYSTSDQFTHRNAVHAKAVAPTVVRLHEDADRVIADDSRGRADPGLELVADHAGAPADASLVDCVGRGGGERLTHVLRGHALTADVVQESVEGFADNR